MRYFLLLTAALLMMGCVGTFSDKFIYIDKNTAAISWHNKDSEFADKGASSARADSDVYEEFYSFDVNGEELQLYLVMFANKYAWPITSTEAGYKRAINELPLISQSEDIFYESIVREPKLQYANAIVDSRECITFIDYLQQHNRSQSKQYRSQIVGVYCGRLGETLSDSKEQEVLEAYKFDAPAYDGRGIMIAAEDD